MSDIVLVTGAGTGMGRLIARTLARANHIVYASMREIEGRNKDKANDARAFAAENHVPLQPIELDILSAESIEAATQRIIREQGRLDVLIHNAAHLYFGVTEAFTPEQVMASLNTNAVGPLRVNRAVLPIMRRQGSGLLLWIGSGTSRVVPPFLAPYTAAKAAMDSFAESVASDVARFGIETSIVMPGPFVDGTAHFSNAEFPHDTATSEAYAPLYGDALARNEEATRGLFAPGTIADVQAVADEVLRIVNLPHGQRPYRAEIDFSDFGDAPVNAVAAAMRARLLRRLGYADLLQPRLEKTSGH
jgi:NAD(P)-dependent dehydrogenase (short-subunit alcohol dehydrogenase family)